MLNYALHNLQIKRAARWSALTSNPFNSFYLIMSLEILSFDSEVIFMM